MQCGLIVPRVGVSGISGVADLMSGKTLLSIKQSKSIGRSCGFGNGRFGYTGFGDNRFFTGTYQKRVTGYNQTGRIPGRVRRSYYVRMRSYRPTNPNSINQQKYRNLFKDAVNSWSLLTVVDKSIYNKRATRLGRVGRNLYTSEYMKNHR